MSLTLRKFVKAAGEVVSQQKGQMAMKLAKGSCSSMEAYNREVGRMEGLDLCVGLLRDMLTQIEDQDSQGEGLPEMPPNLPPGIQTPADRKNAS